MSNKKSIFDYKHIKSVSVCILTDSKGEYQGKILSNYSDNPNGSVCTSQIILYGEYEKYPNIKPKVSKIPTFDLPISKPLIGKAGGGGYDKLSASIADAITTNCDIYPKVTFGGCGIGSVAKWFKENLNLQLIQIV